MFDFLFSECTEQRMMRCENFYIRPLWYLAIFFFL